MNETKSASSGVPAAAGSFLQGGDFVHLVEALQVKQKKGQPAG